MDAQTISDMLNKSIDGVVSISYEEGISDSIPIYQIFIFKTIKSQSISIVTKNIKEAIGREFAYTLLKGCTGELPINVSGMSEVYVISNLDTESGDYLRVNLFKRTNNQTQTDLIGIEQKKIPKGPVVSANVINLTAIVVYGYIENNFDLDAIKNSIEDMSDIHFIQPRITAEADSISEEILTELNNLTGVDAYISDNKTRISFNQSLDEIFDVLESENITHSFESGELAFHVPAGANITEIKNTLTENSINNIELIKEGFVSVPNEVVLNDRVIQMPDNDHFGAILDIDTEIGDAIEIDLMTMSEVEPPRPAPPPWGF